MFGGTQKKINSLKGSGVFRKNFASFFHESTVGILILLYFFFPFVIHCLFCLFTKALNLHNTYVHLTRLNVIT